MMTGYRYAVMACIAVVLMACATQSPQKAEAAPGSSADDKEVQDAIRMINAGQSQAAIDGPLNDVIHRYEAEYSHSPNKIYSTRGPMQSLLYLMAFATDEKSKAPSERRNATALGPTWAMAYWARGYAYGEMARYPEAEAEMTKALALSPNDAQYTGELAYIYQAQKRTEESLALYTAMPDMIPTMDGWSDTLQNELRCKALRGQGYDLVELKRYDEAVVAYKACMQVIPGEPKSKAELGYIEKVRGKGG